MVIYTRKPTKVGKALVIWIPKDIVDHLKIKDDTLLEIRIKKLK